MKDELMKRLIAKIDIEWQEYLQKVYKLPIEQVVLECSYKTIILEEFKGILEMYTENYFAEEQIEKMLQVDNLLEAIYVDWIRYDDDCESEYTHFIFDYWKNERLV